MRILLAEHGISFRRSPPSLAGYYQQRVGLQSTPLEPALDWDEVEAPDSMRRFVTFVNPSPPKGSMLFARLADMLGSARPDIPVLVAPPWFDAVCTLRDDPAWYAAASRSARAAAEERYDERVMRKRNPEYFESLGPGGDLFG